MTVVDDMNEAAACAARLRNLVDGFDVDEEMRLLVDQTMERVDTMLGYLHAFVHPAAQDDDR